MEIGASVGPHVGRIDTLPEEFSFVELTIGEGERRLATLDTETLADRLADRAVGLCDRAEAHGLTVCFETLGYAGGLSLERVGDLAEDAGVAVCPDVGYAYLDFGIAPDTGTPTALPLADARDHAETQPTATSTDGWLPYLTPELLAEVPAQEPATAHYTVRRNF